MLSDLIVDEWVKKKWPSEYENFPHCNFNVIISNLTYSHRLGSELDKLMCGSRPYNSSNPFLLLTDA